MKAESLIAALALLLAMPSAHAATADMLDGISIPTAANPAGWQRSPQGASFTTDAQGNPAVEITQPTATAKMVSASLDLPLPAVRGTIVEVRVDAKAANVTEPAHTYNGIKAMVHVASPEEDTWDQAATTPGKFPLSYDWTTLRFKTSVPADAIAATLLLGLQESSGAVSFRNLHVAIVRRLPQPPATPATGPVYTGHSAGTLRGVMVRPDIKPDDIATLKKWNVNLVRWELMWSGFPHSPADDADLPAYRAWLDGALKHLDEMLPLLKDAGILVALDLHTAPGGRDGTNSDRLFSSTKWQQAFIDIWEMMAKRYSHNSQIWGYDILNEAQPGNVPDGVADWHELAEATAKRIRTIDTAHAIIVEPDPSGTPNGLKFFAPLDVPDIVYSVHMYRPLSFTHQGVFENVPIGPSYPGTVDGKYWDKAQIERYLQSVADYAKNFHVQIYIGEFSAVRWAKGGAQYLQDVIDVMESHGWDWSYHAFREWQGWSLEIGNEKQTTTPSLTPTDRLLVLQKAFASNKQLKAAPSPVGSGARH